jgi:uncharacterized membrane protein (DUF106 family)
MELNAFEKIKEEQKAIRTAVKERVSTAMMGAFGLVAALAWNDAIKALIEYFYPANQGAGLGPKFLYAIIVTIIVAIAVYLLTKFFTDEKK